jgi:hypothetical protein
MLMGHMIRPVLSKGLHDGKLHCDAAGFGQAFDA